MAFKNIILEKDAGIAKLIINRPPVNVMDCDTISEITEAIGEVSADSSVRVLLVRGAGNRAFCAGVEVKDHIGDRVPLMMTTFEKMIKAIRNLGKPSIAVVNGVALGGGCEVVAACDMAIAAENAELGQPEIKLGGLAPAAAALFPRIMGEKKAFELLLLGDNIKAWDAEKIGLLNAVVAADELDAAAEKMAKKFVGMTPIGLRLVKEAFYLCSSTADLESSLRQATELGIQSWATEDAQEGLKSFLEKRPPVWKGK